MHSCDLLVEALNKYEGSYILVSHDRYFISKTANKIWEIEDFKIKEFKGGYEEWVAWKQRITLNNVEPSDRKTRKQNNSNNADEKESPSPMGQAKTINKELKKEIQKQQKLFQQLEEKINQLAEKKLVLEAALVHPDNYSEKKKFQETEKSYVEVCIELENANKDYEILFEKIVSLENNQ
jgi:ATP-binding cassette subfamily F protein 3